MTIIRLLFNSRNPLTEAIIAPNAVNPSPYSFAVLKNSLGFGLGMFLGMFRGTNLRNSPETIKESTTGLHLYSEINIIEEKSCTHSAHQPTLIITSKLSSNNPQTLTIKGGVA